MADRALIQTIGIALVTIVSMIALMRQTDFVWPQFLTSVGWHGVGKR